MRRLVRSVGWFIALHCIASVRYGYGLQTRVMLINIAYTSSVLVLDVYFWHMDYRIDYNKVIWWVIVWPYQSLLHMKWSMIITSNQDLQSVHCVSIFLFQKNTRLEIKYVVIQKSTHIHSIISSD